MTPTVSHNHEWELDEFAASVSAALERSQRQAALKARVQPATYQIQTLSLALGVTMRRDANGTRFGGWLPNSTDNDPGNGA